MEKNSTVTGKKTDCWSGYGLGLTAEELVSLYKKDELSREQLAELAFKAGVDLARRDYSVIMRLPDPKFSQLLRTLLMRLCWKPYQMSEESRVYYDQHKERLDFMLKKIGLLGFGISVFLLLSRFIRK